MKNHLPTKARNSLTFRNVKPVNTLTYGKKVLFFLLTFFVVSFYNAQSPSNFTTSGTWIAPIGVTSITVEAYGGAGAGGAGLPGGGGGNNGRGGGGGGGGAFQSGTYTVIPGISYTITIGTGGTGGSGTRNGGNGTVSTATFNSGTITADFGRGGGSYTNGGNGGAGGTGTRNGGTGGSNPLNASGSGGGGGCAGTTGNGVNGGQTAGGTAGTGGTIAGAGGNGVLGNNTGNIGNNYGGGGSGGTRNGDGANGAYGYMRITFTCPTFSAGSNQTLATCATTATLAATAATAPATGAWTVVSGTGTVTTPTSATSGVTGIVPGTPLVLRWTVSNGNCGSTFSDVTITSPVGAGCLSYCTPISTSSSDYISSFATTGAVTNINNASAGLSGTGYGDFYATNSASQFAGSNLNFTETYNGGNHGLSIWVDLNKNGTFETTERLYNAAAIATGFTGAITIPPATPAGDYRMRIRAWWNNLNPDPCTSITYGEAEDYKLTVLASAPCVAPTAQPTNLVLSPSATSVAGSFTASASANGYLVIRTTSATAPTAPSDGTTYTAGATALGGTILQSSSATTFTDPSLTGGTQYWYWVYAFNNACTGQPAYLTTNPLNNNTTTLIVYCPPTHSFSCTNGIITNVNFNTINNTSTCSSIDGPSYTNYATAGTPTTNLVIGNSYNLSVTTDVSSIVSAWIDFNQNGTFETTEWVQVYTTGTSGTVSFLIPSGAKPGVTRMRIRSRVATNQNGSADACTTFGSGETEGYAITLITPVPCSGTPTGGTANLSANTGTPTTVFTASITGVPNNVSGLTYQWQISDTGTGGWTNISGATTATSNLTADAVVGSTKYYRLATTCTSSTLTGFSTVQSFTTTGCTAPPTSTSIDRYISNVKFLGTLNADTANPTPYSPNGYIDYTGLPAKAKQIVGGGINVFLSNTATASPDKISLTKAWVDWNKDGYFNDNNTERVYTSGIVRLSSTTFGFIVPPGTLPGNYKIRLRTYYVPTTGAGSTDPIYFDGCGSLSNGETEDYSFDVISDCAAKITAVPNFVRCGDGDVTLSATGNGTGFMWYKDEYGGTALSSADTYNATGLLQAVGSYTYYVVATGGTCESTKRTPVYVTVSPVPTVSFSTSEPSICGNVGSIIVGVSGDKEEISLINENFESGLGVFIPSSTIIKTSDGTTPTPAVLADLKSRTQWQSKTSTFIPVEAVWFPAIDSGSNKFAFATSDISTYTYNTTLTYNSTTLNTTGFLNLNLSFDAYFSYYGSTNEGLFVEVFNTTASAWVPVGTFQSSIGIGTHFVNKTVSIPSAYVGYTDLKVRFRYSAGWNDGVAIDNVRLYGDKPLATPFTFTSTASGQVFSAADCTSPATSGTSVCFKPDPAQLENTAVWTLTAKATLKNGCEGSGSFIINNNNKFWNKPVATNDWKSSNWLPETGVPDNTKCVIVKTPVILDASTTGFAKNITILTGTLKIAGNLTVTDYIKNESTPLASNETNFIVETDGNLIQLNSTPSNSGRMTAQRMVKGLRYNPGSAVDYVYWSSPVAGQQTKGAGGFSSGTPNNRFFYYRESNDYFYETGDLTFTPGRGYAVQAETNKGTSFDRLFEFKGTPNNGDIGFGLAFTNAVHGYNLVGNPYPSNINFEQLKYGNNDLIWGTAWFWTNNVYTANQMGSGYSGNNYAIYNGTGGVSATSPYDGGKNPNGIIKVGQAFIVQAKSAGTLNFKNKYDDDHVLRVKTTGDFYSRDGVAKNRFWISLLSPTRLSNSQLIAYVSGATNDFEQDYDAEVFDTYSDLFYSVLTDKKLVIQGKDEGFTPEDKVKLGANFFQAGTYKIELDNAEGIFEESQNIYLKDKQEGIITNLSQGSYTFTATKGDNAGRFEIIYKPEQVLVTESSVKEELTVYRDADIFVVKAQSKKITHLDVFDAAGRLMLQLKPNALKVMIPAEQMVNGIYLLKIDQNGAMTTKKIIR